MLAHEPSNSLAVHEVALVAQLGGDATIAVGLELLADRLAEPRTAILARSVPAGSTAGRSVARHVMLGSRHAVASVAGSKARLMQRHCAVVL